MARIRSLESRILNTKDPSSVTWKRAGIDFQSAPAWQWSAIKLDKQSFKKIQVLDSNHAWIATDEGALYKTADSGVSWARVTPQLPSQSYLTSISFVTPNVGRIALSRTSPQDDDDASWILSTNDGGKNWSQELSVDGAQVGNLLFADQNDGWATGRKFGYVAPQQDKDLILHTVDGGQTWKDLSANLPAPGKGVNELYAVTRGAASVITWNGGMFSTDDTGRTWRQIGTFRDDYEQTAVQRIGSTPSNGLWLLGGAASQEGTWSVLADKPVDGAWTGYRLEGIYLSDAVYLSETAILACGFTNPADGLSPREGVILYSPDRGQNWITTYRNSRTPSVNSIAADSNNIWAVGANGLVLRLAYRDLARAATSIQAVTVPQTAPDLSVNSQSTSMNSDSTRIPFCELLRNAQAYQKTTVTTEAVFLANQENEVVYSSECPDTKNYAWVEFDNSYGQTDEAVNLEFHQKLCPKSPCSLRKVRIMVVGRLEGPNDKGYGHLNDYRYKFEISKILRVDKFAPTVASNKFSTGRRLR